MLRNLQLTELKINSEIKRIVVVSRCEVRPAHLTHPSTQPHLTAQLRTLGFTEHGCLEGRDGLEDNGRTQNLRFLSVWLMSNFGWQTLELISRG